MLDSEAGILIGYKLALIRDLQKNLKIGYTRQYPNISIKLTTKSKKYVRRKLPQNIPDDLCKFHTLNNRLTENLVNLFDALGDNAVLNAKRIFEENAQKWGKKCMKKAQSYRERNQLNRFIQLTYLDIPGKDFIDDDDNRLYWHFQCPTDSSQLDCTQIHYGKLFEVKQRWLLTFASTSIPDMDIIIEPVSEENSTSVCEIKLVDGNEKIKKG